MKILAIDPGTTHSGMVGMTRSGDILHTCADMGNDSVIDCLWLAARGEYDEVAIEMIASYGMPVGAEVFETCVWIGRFVQAFGADRTTLIFRRDVKLHLCGVARAKDKNIRQAIIDMYPRTGGGKTPQVGTKKHRGPLYGVKSHAWAALGVGLTHLGIREVKCLKSNS